MKFKIKFMESTQCTLALFPGKLLLYNKRFDIKEESVTKFIQITCLIALFANNRDGSRLKITWIIESSSTEIMKFSGDKRDFLMKLLITVASVERRVRDITMRF